MGHNSTVRLDQDNEPQPDAVLFVDPARGSQVRIDKAGTSTVHRSWWRRSHPAGPVTIFMPSSMRTGATVFGSTSCGRVLDREIDWFRWRDGEYERLAADPSGVLKSDIFPGLWLDREALVRGDLASVLAVLDRGLATPEHAAFVRRLEAARASP